MKSLIFTLLLLMLTCSLSQAQLTVSGTVQDQRGERLPGANVFLEGTFNGATTELDGSFTFTAPQVGSYMLLVQYMGYEPWRLPLQISETEALPALSIKLKEEAAALGAVTITAGQFEASDENRAASLTTQDIYTTASAMGDAIGAVQTLPGTAPVGEDGRLFVRGGGSEETRLYVNGQPVGSPYGASVPNVPSRGRFSPALFKGFSFSSGAYSAEWGEALSAVLTMGNKSLTDVPTRTDLGIMTVGASASHQQQVGTGGFVVQADYLNLEPYMSAVTQQYDFLSAPKAMGGALAWQQPTKNGRLSLFSDVRSGSMEVSQCDITQPSDTMRVSMRNLNYVGQLQYMQGLGDWAVVTTSASLSADNTVVEPNGAEVEQDTRLLHLKTKMEGGLSRSLSLSGGLETERQVLQEEYRAPEQQVRKLDMQWYRPAAWGQLDWQVNKKLATRLGLRSQYSSRTQRTQVMPRLAMAYQLANLQTVSFAAGEYSQEPSKEWLRLDSELAEAHSRQAVLSYQYESKGRILRVEGYYKDYSHLPLLSQTVGQVPVTASGNGWSSGMELFWRDRKSIKGGDYWVSYTLMDSRRFYADYPEKARPNFVVRHSLNLVYKHFVKKLRSQVGGSFSLASGRPYENPNTAGFLNETAPMQQNLSLNWAFLWKENLILYAAITNTLGGGQAYTYRFSDEANAQGQYGRQAVGSGGRQFFFVGLFFTLSHDKANQLDRL